MLNQYRTAAHISHGGIRSFWNADFSHPIRRERGGAVCLLLMPQSNTTDGLGVHSQCNDTGFVRCIQVDFLASLPAGLKRLLDFEGLMGTSTPEMGCEV